MSDTNASTTRQTRSGPNSNKPFVLANHAPNPGRVPPCIARGRIPGKLVAGVFRWLAAWGWTRQRRLTGREALGGRRADWTDHDGISKDVGAWRCGEMEY